jgi:hypothetical protein
MVATLEVGIELEMGEHWEAGCVKTLKFR